MRNFKRMPEPGPSHRVGPGQAREVQVPAQYGPTGHAPTTMIAISREGAHMEPLIPLYEPGKDELRVVRTGGNSAAKVHAAGKR